MKHYHYIFTGSGLAALMTVYKMAKSGKFKEKTILLLDENQKTNDRTWCFWQIEKATGNHPFQKNGIQHFSPTLILSEI
jgi:lycopene beta-cyclase